jgi:hypothetical protein
MAVSFACPGCATPFRVTPELAGKRAKCPKCLMIFTLPAAEAPLASAAAGKQGPVDLFRDSERSDPDRKRSRRKSVDDDWDDDRDRDDRGRDDRDRDDRDRDEPRPRRSKSRRSGGSALPWVLGLGAAALVLFLFCGGALVVVAYVTVGGRNNQQKPAVVVNNPPMVMNPAPVGKPAVGNPGVNPQPAFGQQVQLRQGLGTRIQLTNGQFQTTTQLAPNDSVDPDDGRFRCKLYQVDLQAGRTYQIDMTTPNPQLFDPFLRLEDANGAVLAQDDDGGGNLNARILFRPNFNGSYIVVATCFAPGMFGTYTLTIRDTTVGGK